jgi:hypothetical protein
MAQELFGTYGGIVENVKDPEKLGRVKVRVPHIYGASGSSTGYIGTNNIPWALPAGMPAGGSPASGGFSHLPDVGDHVWVRFLDGEPEKPIWEWGMQTINDAKGLKLHQYNETGERRGQPQALRVDTLRAHGRAEQGRRPRSRPARATGCSSPMATTMSLTA